MGTLQNITSNSKPDFASPRRVPQNKFPERRRAPAARNVDLMSETGIEDENLVSQRPARGTFNQRGNSNRRDTAQRGGTRGRPGARRGRGRRQQDDNILDDADPEHGNVDPEEKDAYSFLEEHFSENFVNEWDIRGHAEAMEQTNELLDRVNQIEKVQQDHKTEESPDGEMAMKCNDALADVDEGIRKALVTVDATTDSAMQPHMPETIDMDNFYRGKVGAVTAGAGGGGNVVEDGLRRLGDREGHEFVFPKILAKRLIAGEFVKFKSHTERKEVLEAIQHLAQQKDAPSEWKNVKFLPLEPSARKEAVQRMVQGSIVGDGVRKGDLIEAGRMKGPQDVLDTAKRLAGGHYPGGKMQTVLQTINEMLPRDRSQESQQAANR